MGGDYLTAIHSTILEKVFLPKKVLRGTFVPIEPSKKRFFLWMKGALNGLVFQGTIEEPCL